MCPERKENMGGSRSGPGGGGITAPRSVYEEYREDLVSFGELRIKDRKLLEGFLHKTHKIVPINHEKDMGGSRNRPTEDGPSFYEEYKDDLVLFAKLCLKDRKLLEDFLHGTHKIVPIDDDKESSES